MPRCVIVRSPVMVDVLDAVLGRIVRVSVSSNKVGMRPGEEPWFDELCRTAFLRKQADYHRWRRLRSPASWEPFRES